MTCPYSSQCGGCRYRNLNKAEYQELKQKQFLEKLKSLKQAPESYGQAVFIEDGQRRRATFAFEKRKGKVTLGFNAYHSKEIINIEQCPLITPRLNKIIPSIRTLTEILCRKKQDKRIKKKKYQTSEITKGDISLSEADNGIDIVLEIKEELDLEQREAIFDFVQKEADVIRISQRRTLQRQAEPIVEKGHPMVKMGGIDVYIPAGTFLQASKAAETALINQVQKYIGEDTGLIADLFCGVGTFSYPLSRQKENKILAVDSSDELLTAFEHSVNKNKIQNIKIEKRNLFKYPLSSDELKGFDIVVFDPPRAGAKAQVKELAAIPEQNKPDKIIAVSCNPESFVQDANILQENGYRLITTTLVDQFIYSTHMELTALFTRK